MFSKFSKWKDVGTYSMGFNLYLIQMKVHKRNGRKVFKTIEVSNAVLGSDREGIIKNILDEKYK